MRFSGHSLVMSHARAGFRSCCIHATFTALPMLAGFQPNRSERSMDRLVPLAGRVAALLIERRETIAVAESSTGGLISAALLAIPGASAYFVGGAVVYTATARAALLDITAADMTGMRPASEAYAALLARRMRDQHTATWGLGETGATGPTGNRYGDAAGHACIAIAGPVERAVTLETASGDRQANMRAFATRVLELAADAIAAGS
jgi:PncC family amidohydrolase